MAATIWTPGSPSSASVAVVSVTQGATVITTSITYNDLIVNGGLAYLNMYINVLSAGTLGGAIGIKLRFTNLQIKQNIYSAILGSFIYFVGGAGARYVGSAFAFMINAAGTEIDITLYVNGQTSVLGNTPSIAMANLDTLRLSLLLPLGA